MMQYHPIIYCRFEGGASGETVEAASPDEAFRKAAANLLNASPEEVEAMIRQGDLEVIAVVEGDPKFVLTDKIPLFPGF